MLQWQPLDVEMVHQQILPVSSFDLLAGPLFSSELVQYYVFGCFGESLHHGWLVSSVALSEFEVSSSIARDDATFCVGTDGLMSDLPSHWQAADFLRDDLPLTGLSLNSLCYLFCLPKSLFAEFTRSGQWSSTFLDDAIFMMGTDGITSCADLLPGLACSFISACRRQWYSCSAGSDVSMIMAYNSADGPPRCCCSAAPLVIVTDISACRRLDVGRVDRENVMTTDTLPRSDDSSLIRSEDASLSILTFALTRRWLGTSLSNL